MISSITDKVAGWTSAAMALALCGCSDPPTAGPERVRAIKAYTVTELAGGDVRRFAGTVIAANTSSLSFAASGTVKTVDVKQGDRVSAGQVLARLDSKPFELDVEAARSQLQSAQAAFDDKKRERGRQATLFKKKLVAKAAYDQAVAAADIAQGDLNVARSRLAQADRDLGRATLTAPFDGVVAERSVEPFVEVTAGQSLFAINSEGAMEVIFAVPDVIAKRLTVGMALDIEAASIDGCGCTGQVIEIGAAADTANAVPVKAAFANPTDTPIPGSAAEVSLTLASESAERGYLVPLVAIAPGDETHMGYVFKFASDTGTVSKVPISGGEGQENLIEVVKGVSPGDIIAAAGVSFLRDGQTVKLLGE